MGALRLLLFVCLFGQLVLCDIPLSQKNALQDFYTATTGASSWDSAHTWDFNTDPCSASPPWRGITCNSAQNSIESVSLSGYGIQGTLPASFSQLIDLQSLNLDNNQLSGTLPPEWSSLTSLQTLDLGTNQLSGTLPFEWGNMASLQYVGLNINQLSGTLPSEWSNMASLQVLFLFNTQLNGTLPSEWSNMASLQRLFLYDNQLSGTLPSEWSNMASLLVLALNNNKLTGNIPFEWSSWSSLQSLILRNNQLCGDLPSAQPGSNAVDVSGNLFTCPNPAWCSSGSNDCGTCFAEDQGVCTVPQSQIDALQEFYLATNGATTWDVASTWNFAGGNPCSASPPWVGITCNSAQNSIEVISLGGYGNDLVGTLPASLSQLIDLQSLYLDYNQLSGTLPSEWSSFASLQRLQLSTNQLTGNIPPEWSSMSSLQVLSLATNQLSGTIPPEWSTFISLQSLVLQDNRLCGDLPSVQPASNNVAVSGNLFTCPDPAWCASASCGSCYPQAVGSCAVNDDCPGAISLTSGASVTGINIGANPDDSRISSSCGSISSANGMWFTFNSQTNDLVTLSLCGGSDFDTLLQLFSGTCGTSALVCMSNDDNGCGGVESLLSNIVIQTNTQYFVLVSGSSSSESGQFSLTMSLSSTSGGGGDPYIKDSCGNLFDIPSHFAGKIMQLYHDDQLHINAFIDHQSKFFTQIGVKLRVNPNNDYFETLECRLDNGYPNFYLNGVSLIDHPNVLPDWVKVYEPRHRSGAGVLSELGRYQKIELELASMLIIVGGDHPVLKGFFNVQVNRQPVDHSSLFHCPQEGHHERSSLDLFKFIRDSIFEQ